MPLVFFIQCGFVGLRLISVPYTLFGCSKMDGSVFLKRFDLLVDLFMVYVVGIDHICFSF